MSIRTLDKYLYAAKTNRRLREDYTHPPCVICGGDVVRRPTEGATLWKRRLCCSRACAGIMMRRRRHYDAIPEDDA